jgi:hypothetical protein
MLLTVEVAAFAVLGCCLLLPVVWAWRFSWLFPPRGDRAAGAVLLPPAAVVLALRGADPSLRDCLRGLLNQDYPCYAVWIVVDSGEDPARALVQEVLDELSPRIPVHVDLLHEQRETCGLKMGAQLQAIAELENAYDVVAMIDADVVPARDWLQSLVLPLLDDGVGASTGIRWYTPEGQNWGTLVRYMWNAAAVTQMHSYSIPWGGSLAFRTAVLREAGLLAQWSHSLCEDTSAQWLLRRRGLRLAVVPAVTILSRESTDLKSCFSFIRRQLVCCRLYLGNWVLLMAGNGLWGLAMAGACLGAPLAALLGHAAQAALLAGLAAGSMAAMVGALLHVEKHARQMGRARGIEVRGLPCSVKTLPALALTMGLYAAALAAAVWARRVEWRGISYRIQPGGQVRLVTYRPYRPSGPVAEAEGSLM